jgi:hypothetical protein
MASFIPAGRLSAVDHGDQRLEIQTEFSKFPEPRIATTVSLSGTVIHKIQKLWGKTIDTLDDMREVEEVIHQQHDEVTALVHEHGATLIDQNRPVETKVPSYNDLVEQVANVPQVQSAFYLSGEGQLYAQTRVTKEAEVLAKMVVGVCEVLLDIAKISNLGDCDDCVLQLGSHDVLFVSCLGGYVVALIDPKVRKREVLTEIQKIARAA